MIRLFNDPFFNTLDSVFESVNNAVTKPRSNINKTENGYNVVLYVPGLSKDDLKIIIKDRKLTIKHESEDNNFIESFTKNYFLSDDIIENKITAEVKNGILIIDLPTSDQELMEKIIDVR